MEGFQFGEQTQGAATSLNCETGGGERGSGSGHRLSNTPDFHIRHQMLGLTPLGGGKRKALGQGCPKEGGCGRLVPHSTQSESSLQPSSPTHTITQRHFSLKKFPPSLCTASLEYHCFLSPSITAARPRLWKRQPREAAGARLDLGRRAAAAHGAACLGRDQRRAGLCKNCLPAAPHSSP